MRTIICIILLISKVTCYAQGTIAGFYASYHGDKLEIRSDSTFEYTYGFDLYSTWTQGVWSVRRDTIFFQWIPVYDTVQRVDKKRQLKDELILALDNKPERISSFDADGFFSYGQNFYPYPLKLYFKRNRLYKINKDGHLEKKRTRGIWIKKKFPPWYRKVKKEDLETNNTRFSEKAAMYYI